MMLFMLHVKLSQPANMSNQEFYRLWQQEAQAALSELQSGEIEALYKVPGKSEVIGMMRVKSLADLDLIYQTPIARMGYAHIVTEITWTPLRPYQDWAEELERLACQ